MSRETVLDIAELSRRVEADEYRLLGEARLAKGDISDAVAYYQMSLDSFPTVEAYLALSEAFAARGLLTEAVAQARAALVLEPWSGAAHNTLGIHLLQGAKTQSGQESTASLREEAWGHFEAATRDMDFENRQVPYFYLGHIAEQKAHFLQARSYYYRSLTIAPHGNPARVALHRVVSWLN